MPLVMGNSCCHSDGARDGECHVIWVYDVSCVRWLLEAYLVILVFVGETGSGSWRGALAESSRSLDRVTDAYVARDLRCEEFHESLTTTWTQISCSRTHRAARSLEWWWDFRWWERLRSLAGVCMVSVGALSGDDSGIWWEAAYAWSRWEFSSGRGLATLDRPRSDLW